MARDRAPRGDGLSRHTFAAIAQIAHNIAGLSLPPSKRAMVAARISKRLSRLALEDYEEYLALISQPHAPERRRMIAALTTNVSSFFRERQHFDALRNTILPPLLSRALAGARVRIWSAGCAHGQEAYSIALEVLELLPTAHLLDIRILGTDIDPSVVQAAHLGAYHRSLISNVPLALRDRHFTFDASAEAFSAKPALRELVTFRELNLQEGWPMPGRFDIIFCRNVVIYFDSAGQKRLWSRFHDKLLDGGWLIIGHSERIHTKAVPGFKAVDHTIYRRCHGQHLQSTNKGLET